MRYTFGKAKSPTKYTFGKKPKTMKLGNLLDGVNAPLVVTARPVPSTPAHMMSIEDIKRQAKEIVAYGRSTPGRSGKPMVRMATYTEILARAHTTHSAPVAEEVS